MDKREKQVKDRLVQAMISLSAKKEWTKITITDLINYSGVARASFYRNFNGLNELIEYGIDQLHANFWKKAPEIPGSFLNIDMLTYTFEYYKQNAGLILSFHHSGLSISVVDVLTENMILSFGDMPEKSLEKYQIYYYGGALYNMMICWLENGMKETPGQMAKVFFQLKNNEMDVKI